MQESLTPDLGPCPPWCRRDHRPDDHPDDLRHQGPASTLAVTLASTVPPSVRSHAVEVVAYADQPVGAPHPWIRIESLESRDLRMALSADAARELVHALRGVLDAMS